MCRRGVLVGDEPLAARDEVLPRMGFGCNHSGSMPGLTVPSAAADVTDRKDAATLEPCDARRAEGGFLRYPVRAVTVQIRGMRPVEFEVFAIDDRERYHRAVLTACLDLGRRVRRHIDFSEALNVRVGDAAVCVDGVVEERVRPSGDAEDGTGNAGVGAHRVDRTLEGKRYGAARSGSAVGRESESNDLPKTTVARKHVEPVGGDANLLNNGGTRRNDGLRGCEVR